MNLDIAITKLEVLKYLEDDWDGEGAKAPNEESIEKGRNFLKWVEENDLEIDDVLPDVCNGVGIMLNGTTRYEAWISFMNDFGDDILITSKDDDNFTKWFIWDEKSKDLIIEYLRGKI